MPRNKNGCERSCIAQIILYYNKQIRFFIFLFLISYACYGQIDIARDTLQLEEAVAVKSDKRQKMKKYRLEGTCSYPEDMKDAVEIITLVDNLPKGKLGTVTFYFNKIDTESYRQNSKYFKDADFEVVLYDVNDDDMPGIPSAIEKQVMVVDKAHRGKVTVDLSYFGIDTNKKMFIGLRKLTSGNDNRSFLIDCLCSGQDKYITYYRKDASARWQRRWVCAAIKMEVNIIAPDK